MGVQYISNGKSKWTHLSESRGCRNKPFGVEEQLAPQDRLQSKSKKASRDGKEGMFDGTKGWLNVSPG